MSKNVHRDYINTNSTCVFTVFIENECHESYIVGEKKESLPLSGLKTTLLAS